MDDKKRLTGSQEAIAEEDLPAKTGVTGLKRSDHGSFNLEVILMQLEKERKRVGLVFKAREEEEKKQEERKRQKRLEERVTRKWLEEKKQLLMRLNRRRDRSGASLKLFSKSGTGRRLRKIRFYGFLLGRTRRIGE